MRLFCLCLLVWLVHADNDYLEVTVSSELQRCVLNSTLCLQPSCATCEATATAHNVSFVKMGRVVSAQFPPLTVTVPENLYLDTLRLQAAVPLNLRPVNATIVTQMINIGCNQGTAYNTMGKVVLLPETGDLEVSRALMDFNSRFWPMQNTTCGTLSSVIMTWLL